LRALLWWVTSDLTKATRWAAYAGRTFGWTLMIVGLLNAFRGELGNGLWLVLIGWFLSNAAQTSLQQHLLTQALSGVSVKRVMRTRFERIGPEATVEQLAERVMHGGGDQRAFPVEREGLLLGLVCLQDMRNVPREEWPRRRVDEIMTPVHKLTMMRADVPAQQAADELAKNDVDNIPVVADSPAQEPVLLGMVRRADILRWVYLSNQPA
jgi:CBS domain-containing protein